MALEQRVNGMIMSGSHGLLNQVLWSVSFLSPPPLQKEKNVPFPFCSNYVLHIEYCVFMEILRRLLQINVVILVFFFKKNSLKWLTLLHMPNVWL